MVFAGRIETIKLQEVLMQTDGLDTVLRLRSEPLDHRNGCKLWLNSIKICSPFKKPAHSQLRRAMRSENFCMPPKPKWIESARQWHRPLLMQQCNSEKWRPKRRVMACPNIKP